MDSVDLAVHRSTYLGESLCPLVYQLSNVHFTVLHPIQGSLCSLIQQLTCFVVHVFSQLFLQICNEDQLE